MIGVVMAKYFLIPGFRGSDENHWQSFWLKSLPNAQLIVQDNWGANVTKDDWVSRLEATLQSEDLSQVILIGHSLGVATIIHWANQYNHKIRGALLVAPTNVDQMAQPIDANGFAPMPLNKLNFPSIIIASTNDIWIDIERAQEYSKIWGSEFENIGAQGHINSDSKLGEWEVGRKILERL